MFSLFSRKDKTADKPADKQVDKAPARFAPAPAPVQRNQSAAHQVSAPSGVSTPARRVDQAEAARRTSASIDAIEFEMLAPGTTNAPKIEKSGDFNRASSPPNVAPKPQMPPSRTTVTDNPPTLPKLDHNTSIVLGDTSGALNIDVSGTTLPPMIEEAAILYANGQAKEAQDSLKHAIGSGELENQVQTAWVMLLDVLQSTGQRAEFENTALDYAARFEASPPAWLELTNEPKAEVKKTAMAATVVFPAAIDTEISKNIEQLQKGAATKRDLQIDFGNAKTATAEGAEQILKVLNAFKKLKRDLSISHGDRLFDALYGSIEAGRRDPSEACWLLALEMLRLLNQQQRFDDVSIDYCVTYEVSPPPWEPMPAFIKPSMGATTIAQIDSQPKSGKEGNSFAMRGELLGAISQELAELRTYAQSTPDIVIDCRQLTRVDFTAAGELLNVIAALRANGKQVLFVEPNWLVLALMVVMGIHDLAEIRRRKI